MSQVKERVKNMSLYVFDGCLLLLQVKLEQTEAELRSLSAEFQGLRSSLAQRDTHALQLRDTICSLTTKTTTAHRKEVRHTHTHTHTHTQKYEITITTGLPPGNRTGMMCVCGISLFSSLLFSSLLFSSLLFFSLLFSSLLFSVCVCVCVCVCVSSR